MLAARWAEAKVRPAAVADDGEFLRRVSLDLIGKIPTAAEARDFLDDPSPGKRLALVERLLDSPAYTTRATEIWRRLLLPEADTEDLARQVAGDFEAWLRKKVIEEAGYDRIVREILTAKLDGRNADSPLAGSFRLPRATTRPRRASPRTSPPAWHGFSSESAWNVPSATIIRSRAGSGNNSGASPPSSRTCRPRVPENAVIVRRDPDAAPRRELTIPGTKKVVKASHLDGSTPAWRPRADTREILAEWVTAPDNPVFRQGRRQPRLGSLFRSLA